MIPRVLVPILMIFFLKSDSIYAQFSEEVKSLNDTTTWIGKNGNGFRGAFIKREGDILTIIKENPDKLYKIDINNLHPNTKKWFLSQWEKKENKTEAKPQKAKLSSGVVIDLAHAPLVDSSEFKLVDEEKAPRSLIPSLNQSDYGKKTSDCVPNSYAMFMTWWHLRDWIKIPKGRDFQDKVEWLHQRLARTMKTRNNSGTRISRTAENLTKFFSNEVKCKTAFTFQQVEDYRPENLSKFVKGANCTVLYLSTYHGRKYQGGHAVALKRMDEDGTLEFNTWGLSLKGKLKPIPGSEQAKRISVVSPEGRRKVKMIKLLQYEIELINKVDLPEWFVDTDVRFLLEADKYDQLIVLTPYLAIGGGTEIKK